MSAICGILNLDGAPVDPELLRKMAEAALHRGPDGIHYWIEGQIGLAHLALHTTPESLHERQPLTNHRGDLVLVADARLDNRDDLIQTLSAKDCLHANHPTDADLILAAYECWEENCPEHLIGEFTFSVWDSRRKRLLAARDQVGGRTLYYRATSRVFQWATEAVMLLADPAFPARLDEVMVARDLAMVGSGGEHESYYLGISRLGPAERLTLGPEGLLRATYWDFNPEYAIRYRTDQEYVDHFASLFRRAVRDRLRSIRPVGLFMSGGIDSTSVAATAAAEMRQNPGAFAPELHAVHWTLKDPRLSHYDESLRSKPVAERWGFRYREIDIQPFHQLYHDPLNPPHLDEPFQSQLHAWYNASMTALDGPNAPRRWLTGHIGDMMVGGSNPYYYLGLLKSGSIHQLRQELKRHRELYGLSSRQMLGLILPFLIVQPARQGYRRWIRRQQVTPPPFITPELARKTYLSEWMFSHASRQIEKARMWRDKSKRLRYQWINYAGDLRLRAWFDRLAAAHHAEISTPWDDLRLREFIMAIPEEQICQGVNHKLILRRAMCDLLPEATRERRGLRVGTPMYITEMLRSPDAAARIDELLSASRAAEAGFIDLSAFRRVIDDYRCGRRPYSLKLWSVLSLEIWLRAQTHLI